MPDHSKCCVAGVPVNARRYVQVLPLQEVGDDGPPTFTVTKIVRGELKTQLRRWSCVACDGKRYAVPHATADERIDGKRFVNLAPEPGEICEALDLDPAGVYELRHNPPRKVKRVPAEQMAEFDLVNRRGVLIDGRRVAINRYFLAESKDGGRVPTFEVDYGVLQKYVCRGEQARAQIDLWRRLLLAQLLEG
jgi:hypothetical protein